MSDTDLQLLARYIRDHAEDAFSELVRRHLDLVHSAALRQVRSPQLAEEVAQSVFTDLARNATKLKPDTILTAWLYQVTRRTAIDVVRREARRQLREQIATEMNAMNATTSDWTNIEPLLDDAMSALDETDRAAVLLRYFENKSLREVGATLGTSDDAAQKRVSRAVERLREFFAKRGVTVGTSGLVVVISANAIHAAPVGLAVTISTASALVGTTTATGSTAIAIKTIAMTTLQKTLITATIVAAIGTGIYEARQASTLRTQVQTLQQEQAQFAEQIQQLQREHDDATQKLTALRDDNERLNRNTTELLKLRGQVGVFHQELAAARQRTESDPIGAWTIGKIRWRPEWKDVGLSSPEAAIETFWWALENKNIDKVRQTLVFDRVTNAEPVSELFAKREARSDGGIWKMATLGGVRLSSAYQDGDENRSHADVEVEVMRPPIDGGEMIPVDPANPPSWSPNIKNAFHLMKVDGEWKVVGDEHRLKLTLDDEDSAAVANLLIKMPPEQIEELKSKSLIPDRTLRVYEELKASGTK
jgi:RNA polymerase sigma factor (sigma-70 family)